MRITADEEAETTSMRREPAYTAGQSKQVPLSFAQPNAETKVPPLLPLKPVKELPLSFAQQRLWFIDRIPSARDAYHVARIMRLAGRFDVVSFRQAISEMVRRHESLRTTFPCVDGEPKQHIHPPKSVSFPVVDLEGLPLGEQGREIERLTRHEATSYFDLGRGPLFRVLVLRTAPEEHVLTIVFHHIIADGWSLGVFYRELSALYQTYAAGNDTCLPEPHVQYSDYTLWQRECVNLGALQVQVAYWRGRLRGSAAVLPGLGDRPRAEDPSFRGSLEFFELPRDLADGLRKSARQSAATLYVVFVTAFGALLYRQSGATDICIGTPIANRNYPWSEGIIGFVANTLVLRIELSGEMSLEQLLQRVRQEAIAAYDNQDAPFDLLVAELQLERNPAENAFFQVAFALQNAPAADLVIPGVQVTSSLAETGTSRFDLTLSITEEDGDLNGLFEYSTDLFEHTTIGRFVRQYEKILRCLITSPRTRLRDIPLISDAERQELLARSRPGVARRFPSGALGHGATQL